MWGDPEAGEVADLIYASTERIHCLVFALPVGGRFTHSPEFRTVFGADELLHVLSGTMVLANPETGEVARVAAGQSVTFGPDTWHHAFAHGHEPLRVLEMFAPPPSAGTTGAHARTRPYLETSRYADDSVLGHVPGARAGTGAFRVVRDEDIVWRRDLGVLAGVHLSTEHITMHTLEIDPGQAAIEHRHGGDELLFVLRGELWVRAWQDGQGVRLRARAGGRVLHPGRVRARVPRLRRRAGRGDGRHRAPLPAVTRLAVGIDVGGTKIAAGLCDLDRGQVLARHTVATPRGDGPAALAACAAAAARVAPGGAPIGLGLCELVDREGRPKSAQTLDWRELDIAAAFASTGPVVVDSDVRTAGRAEALLGAGRGYGRLIFLNIGTGISYALLRDGVPDPGARGYAIIVGAPAVEDVAGGYGLATLAGEADARAVFANPAHAALVERAVADLGAAIASLVNALDPEAVVIGGGLGLVESYREAAVAAARPLIWAEDVRDLPIVPAALGGDGAVLGAALAAPAARA